MICIFNKIIEIINKASKNQFKILMDFMRSHTHLFKWQKCIGFYKPPFLKTSGATAYRKTFPQSSDIIEK